MKKKVNHNLLSLLVVITLLISITSLWISIDNNQITGLISGFANVTVATTTTITCQNTACNVYLGSLGTLATNDTMDNDPEGFNITNDGNVVLNITVLKGADLFTNGDTDAFQFNFTCISDVYCANSTDNADSNITTWTDITTSAKQVVDRLNFTDGWDMFEIEINVTVPSAEASGLKSATLTITASDAT